MTFDDVRDRAIEVMGCPERADVWLEKPDPVLGGKPEEIAATEAGACRVLTHLHALEITSPE